MTSRTVAVVGAGTIGLSWAALAAAAGHRVRISDPRSDLPEVVDRTVRWLSTELPGTDPDELLSRMVLCSSTGEAVTGADVVHENGPERIPVKRAVFAEVAAAARPEALLLTSTSGLDPNEIGAELSDASRLLVAHPFNPPHLIPLVEVVPATATSDATVAATMDYLRTLGRHPVLIHQVRDGFVANRLQRALFQEAVSLVADGVVSVAELDDVVTSSLGPRWATAGPFLSFHLGGGPGGMRHMIEHLMAGRFPDEVNHTLVQQTEQAYGNRTYEDLVRERGRTLPAVLAAARDDTPTTAGDES